MVSKTRQAYDCDAVTRHLLSKLWNGKPVPKPYQVRRNLFGISRHDRKTEILSPDKRMIDMAKKSSQEWNFDFVNEVPKKGRYVWQRVRCCEVPLWYAAVRRPALKDFCAKKDDYESVEDNSCPLSSNRKYRLKDENETQSEQNNKKSHLVQTSMKDFTRVQKRRSSHRLRLKQLRNKRLQRHPTKMLPAL